VKLVLATFNHGKLREFRQRLGNLPVELLSLNEFEGALGPVETGATLEENARLKARAAFELTRLPCVADDTGLEIDALSGRPGVRSARYAGPNATDAANREAVLQQMTGIPGESRGARFRTVIVACFAGGPDVVAEGVLEGRITFTPRGEQGFGYDSIFEPAGMDRTLAELTLDEKNRISHRARAIAALLPALGLD
jgi:XTP/dITP diphosphohydrolase